MTTTSDLKNNYTTIKVSVSGEVVNTDRIKIGCFMGDHSKTGIGTMLNTGISIGFSCNLYGAGLFSERAIPSFSWGTADGLVGYDLEKAVQTARAAITRRGVEFTGAHDRLFAEIWKKHAAQSRLRG